MKRTIAFLAFSLGWAASAFAGFASTEQYLAAVGRVAGQGGAQFYTTVWATNLTGAPVSFTFDFLKQGQANASPASFSDSLAPGETKVYENVVETKLGLSNAIGAARVISTGEILLAERIYDQAAGDDVGNTVGLFFAGVPKSFSIGLGQSASIQGINQGGAENFRYNFALVETGGGSPTVNVQLFDGNGTMLGQKAYALQPYEQIQPNVADLFPGIATTNARITATVTGGTGAALIAGAQLANESQDSSGFEMSFRDSLLGGGGTAGVTSVNGLTGAVTLAAGSNVSLAKSGNTITINAAGGGGGALVLPFTGSTSSNQAAIDVSNNGSGAAFAGESAGGNGMEGTSTAVAAAGVKGVSNGSASSAGVRGSSTGGQGVWGESTDGNGAYGVSSGTNAAGVFGNNLADGPGVRGDSASGDGVIGVASGSGGNGVEGTSVHSVGVRGTSNGNDGVLGTTTANTFSGVYGQTNASGYGVYGEADDTNGGAAIGGNAPNGGKAAHFYGGDVYVDHDLHVTGKIFAGTKDFQIDHPLDPANKYLVHASIESSEMMNIYSGNATLDGHGVATIDLPTWMEAENGDFRYQITAVGGSQPGLFVARKVRDHRFVVAGGVPGGEISWQLTGVRHDAWAVANPLVVEEKKPERERGFYLHPGIYGAPPDRQMNWADEPKTMERIRDARDPAR